MSAKKVGLGKMDLGRKLKVSPDEAEKFINAGGGEHTEGQGAQKSEPAPAQAKPVPVEVVKEATTRLNVDMPISQHRKLKMLSVERGKTIREIILELVDDHLNTSDE